jgi:hypothetical protein
MALWQAPDTGMRVHLEEQESLEKDPCPADLSYRAAFSSQQETSQLIGNFLVTRTVVMRCRERRVVRRVLISGHLSGFQNLLAAF